MTDEELFEAARHLPDHKERQAYLTRMTADPSQRARVGNLLSALVDAGSFLDRPVMGGERADAPQGAASSPPETQTVRLDSAAILGLLSPSTDPASLGRLGDYEIREVLGQGGMGCVLKALDPKLNRVVAVKIMSPAFLSNAVAVKRFLREAQAAAAVAHEHVVRIYAVEDTPPVPYLVMECVVGQSLQQKLERVGMLDVRSILRIGSQIAQGLAAAHRQGLVHRDIKPANILLENGIERVKITDFGLARAIDDTGLTQPGQVTGTPQYMSPEQALGEMVDHRSDLFSLGSVIYAMCTGRPAFHAESTVATLRRVVDATPRPILDINPDCPPWLAAYVERLLQKDPAQRYQTAAEVADLLEGALARLQQPRAAGFEPTAVDSHVPVPPAPTRANAATTWMDAWEQWWAKQDPRWAKPVYWLLIAIHFIGMILFISMGLSSHDEGGHRVFRYTLGAPGPWFRFIVNEHGKLGFSFGFNLVSSAMICGLVGWLAYHAAWRIERVLHPQVSGWNHPRVVMGAWSIAVIVALGMGFYEGFQAIHARPISSPTSLENARSTSPAVTNTAPNR